MCDPSREESPTDETFEPKIGRLQLPKSVATERRAWDAANAQVELALAPRVEARIKAAQFAIDGLADLHRDIVDRTDIDLEADTRWVAVLEVTSRCISLADALVDQLRSGYGAEIGGTCRVLHESLDLALAVASGEDKAVRRWLRGKKYPTGLAKQARTAYFARMMEMMGEALGQPFDSDPVVKEHVAGLAELGISMDQGLSGALHSIGGRVYGDLSQIAHNQRGGLQDSVSVRLRRFTYGAHPDAHVRAHYVELGDGLVEQAVLDVGASLAEVVGFEAVRIPVMRLLAAIQASRANNPFQ